MSVLVSVVVSCIWVAGMVEGGSNICEEVFHLGIKGFNLHIT